MIVDCGGGTTDMTVYQIDSGGRLKDIFKTKFSFLNCAASIS